VCVCVCVRTSPSRRRTTLISNPGRQSSLALSGSLSRRRKTLIQNRGWRSPLASPCDGRIHQSSRIFPAIGLWVCVVRDVGRHTHTHTVPTPVKCRLKTNTDTNLHYVLVHKWVCLLIACFSALCLFTVIYFDDDITYTVIACPWNKIILLF